ncbi:FAD-dependent monooxygenase [Amycolatopsis samaneae]|uniref:FAD-dependent monooxygenase n=1 Tax=Amycolatopsis samaneae TaxID=664691 RepID=A0ABW5GRT8_9PSEU
MDTDVVIAGGGPVGLMLAAELGLLGVGTVVLERLREPTRQSRALSLHVRTAQTLDRRGLLKRFLDEQEKVLGIGAGARRTGSHFAGIEGVDFSLLDTDVPHLAFMPQTVTERLLGERAAELGVVLRRGHEVTGFTQTADAVEVRVAGERDHTLRARYLVGCDGGASTVRKLAGIDFPGTRASVAGMTGELVLTDPATAPKGWRRTGRGWTLMLPYPHSRLTRVVTIDFAGPEDGRDTPPTLAELERKVLDILGYPVPMAEPTWISRFSDASRIATGYLDGRVLLAGDAAHIHFPAGGPGLNIGLQDAVNLGWKLAATVRGHAPGDLLASYPGERRPVAEAVLRTTRAQLALMRTGEDVDPLRELFAELMRLDEVRTHLTELSSGFGVRYPMPGADPGAGGFAPDVRLATPRGTRRLAELLHPGRAVLLLTRASTPYARAAEGWSGRVDTVTAAPEKREGVLADVDALLIRPDGYTAWSAPAGAAPGTTAAGLDAALRTWFGVPARTTQEVS